MEDYETDVVEIWPDNELACSIFRRVGTRWRSPPMGGVPIGLQWEAIYPLMERQKLDDDQWNDLHDDLMVLEAVAIEVMREFAPAND
nr:DUF1799 domain-containing protein [uncultured Comamonas sp.]